MSSCAPRTLLRRRGPDRVLTVRFKDLESDAVVDDLILFSGATAARVRRHLLESPSLHRRRHLHQCPASDPFPIARLRPQILLVRPAPSLLDAIRRPVLGCAERKEVERAHRGPDERRGCSGRRGCDGRGPVSICDHLQCSLPSPAKDLIRRRAESLRPHLLSSRRPPKHLRLRPPPSPMSRSRPSSRTFSPTSRSTTKHNPSPNLPVHASAHPLLRAGELIRPQNTLSSTS